MECCVKACSLISILVTLELILKNQDSRQDTKIVALVQPVAAADENGI